jgi:DNA-binding CsgD family transcriptional regulator
MAVGDNGSSHDCCCNSPRLTRGEVNVLVAIAAGMTSKAAGSALRLSKSTVDGHIDAMRAKAGARTRGELLAVAVSLAIIDLTDGTPRWTGRYCLSPNPETQTTSLSPTSPPSPRHSPLPSPHR